MTGTSAASTASEFRNALKALERAGVQYCVLRNFEFLFGAEAPERDLDVSIALADAERTRRLLVDAGFRQVFRGPLPGHLVFSRYSESANHIVTLDLQVGGLTADGLLYWPEHGLLRDRRLMDGVYVPSVAEHAATLVLHAIVDKRGFRDRDISTIERLLAAQDLNPAELRLRFESALSPGLGRALCERLMARDFSGLLRLRRRILLHRVLAFPLGILNRARITMQRVRWVLRLRPAGPLVAFVGPDGSGKTSASATMRAILEGGTIRTRCVYMGWRGSVLPVIPFLMRADRSVLAPSRDGPAWQRAPTTRQIRSVLIGVLYGLELGLRYLLRIYPARRLGYVVVTDRYFYDRVALDPTLPRWLRWAFVHLTPRPTCCFYMTAEPDVLAVRESNLSHAQLTKQKVGFDSTYATYDAVRIDTGEMSPESTSRLSMRMLWSALAR